MDSNRMMEIKNTIIATILTLLYSCHIINGEYSNQDLRHDNITHIVSKLLENYDKRIAPSLDGSPIDVGVSIYISTMVPLELLDFVSKTSFFYLRTTYTYTGGCISVK